MSQKVWSARRYDVLFRGVMSALACPPALASTVSPEEFHADTFVACMSTSQAMLDIHRERISGSVITVIGEHAADNTRDVIELITHCVATGPCQVHVVATPGTIDMYRAAFPDLIAYLHYGPAVDSMLATRRQLVQAGAALPPMFLALEDSLAVNSERGLSTELNFMLQHARTYNLWIFLTITASLRLPHRRLRSSVEPVIVHPGIAAPDVNDVRLMLHNAHSQEEMIRALQAEVAEAALVFC